MDVTVTEVINLLSDHDGYEWWPMTREFICKCETSLGRSYPDKVLKEHVAEKLLELFEKDKV